MTSRLTPCRFAAEGMKSRSNAMSRQDRKFYWRSALHPLYIPIEVNWTFCGQSDASSHGKTLFAKCRGSNISGSHTHHSEIHNDKMEFKLTLNVVDVDLTTDYFVRLHRHYHRHHHCLHLLWHATTYSICAKTKRFAEMTRSNDFVSICAGHRCPPTVCYCVGAISCVSYKFQPVEWQLVVRFTHSYLQQRVTIFNFHVFFPGFILSGQIEHKFENCLILLKMVWSTVTQNERKERKKWISFQLHVVHGSRLLLMLFDQMTVSGALQRPTLSTTAEMANNNNTANTHSLISCNGTI